MKISNLILISLASFGLTSCALTNSVQKINYEPKFTVNEKLEKPQIITIEAMTDNRGAADNKLLFNKKNMYNQTMSGAYLSEKPVTEILQEAIVYGLNKKNISNSSNTELTLKSQLEKLDYEAISGFTTVQLIPQITVKFRLIDSNNKVIWMDMITGKATTRGTNFSKFFPPAIDNLVNQLLESEEFISQIENYSNNEKNNIVAEK
jgi:hypothetical protein